MKQTARMTGALYLLAAFMAPFSMIYVPRKLFVANDAAATATNIRNSEMLFRTSITVGLISTVLFVVVILGLYRLFKNVDRTLAVAMATLILVSVPLSLVTEVSDLTALSLLREPGSEALAMVFLRIDRATVTIAELFWGLWLFPFGLLVIRSRFLPRILGYLLLANGLAYVLLSLTSLLAPASVDALNRWTFPALFGEVWIMLWLVIRGVNVTAEDCATPMQPTLARG
jgi:hypothetical protein